MRDRSAGVSPEGSVIARREGGGIPRTTEITGITSESRYADDRPPSSYDATAAMKPRTGKLYRRTDVSGVSGTGPVAWIVEWPDGTAAMRWNKTRTGKPGTCTPYEYGVPQIEDIHGHDGMSHVIWDD